MQSSLHPTAQSSLPVFFERYSGAAGSPLAKPVQYKRREPEKTVLYEIIRRHLETFLAQGYLQTEDGVGYPAFVEKTFRAFLVCGLTQAGFVRVRCKACGADFIVGFSCKCRGVCLSCESRRMSDTAAHLVDRVLPKINYRQWVLTLPFKVRLLVGRDPNLLTEVLNIFIGCVFAWYRKKARKRGIVDGKPGSITFVQRFGGFLNANSHLHSVMASGVFTVAENGKLKFHRLAGPQDLEVVQIAKRIAKRVSNLVEKYLSEGPNADDLGAHDQAIAEAVQVNFPFIESYHDGENQDHYIRGRQCANVDGYSLHAQTSVGENSREALERLCRYGARPAFAMDRLELLPDGRVRYRLKKVWVDGTTHLVMDPLVFMRRLASFIPSPYRNLTRYHGVFASNSNLRPLLLTLLPQGVLVTPSSKLRDKREAKAPDTPSSKSQEATSKASDSPKNSLSSRGKREAPQAQEGSQGAPPLSASLGALAPEPPSEPKTIRPRRLPWAELLKRTFRIDLTQCAKCQGLLIIIAFITDPVSVYKILSHLNMPTEVPPTEPSRIDNQMAFELDELDEPGDEEFEAVKTLRPQRGPPSVEWVRV